MADTLLRLPNKWTSEPYNAWVLWEGLGRVFGDFSHIPPLGPDAREGVLGYGVGAGHTAN